MDMLDSGVINLTPELRENLKARREALQHEDQIELDPVAGGQVVGELTLDERAIFVEMILLYGELEEMSKELAARSVDAIAAATRASDKPQDLEQRILDQPGLFRGFAECEDYFRNTALADHLKHWFWWTVRSRLNSFTSKLDVRAGFKVVKIGSKYVRAD